MAEQVVYSEGRLLTEQGRQIAGDALQGAVDVTFDDVVVDDLTVQDLAVTGSVTLSNSADITVGTGAGTKIGTTTTGKLGFFNATPVAQPSALTQTYAIADATLAALTAVAPAAMTAADLTDNSGGTSGGTTIAVVTDNASAANAIATLAAMVDKLTVDLAASRAEVVKLVADHADLAQFTNSLTDKLQALGLVG